MKLYNLQLVLWRYRATNKSGIYRSTTKIHQGEPNLYLEPEQPRQPNPTTVWLVQLQVRETSSDGSMDRNTGDTAQPRYTDRKELD